MRLKRIFSIIFLLIFGYLIGWLFVQALQPEVLPVGSSLPKFEYSDSIRKKTLMHIKSQNIILVLFNRGCEHCQYQLKQFNKNMDKFVDTQLILFTTEQNFFTKGYIEQFDILAQAENVNWGIVNKKEFKSKFGSMVLPSIFLFDKSGKLINKIRGEVKIDKIIENLGGPERQVSGYK